MGQVINFGTAPKVIEKKRVETEAEVDHCLRRAKEIAESDHLSAGEKTEMVAELLESTRDRVVARIIRQQRIQ